MPLTLHDIQREADDLARMRLLKAADSIVTATNPARKYSKANIKVMYFDDVELREFIKKCPGKLTDLEGAVLKDLSAIYESIFNELSDLYDDLLKLYVKKKNKKGKPLPYIYGLPNVQPEQIDTLFRACEVIANKNIRKLNEDATNASSIPYIQTRLHRAIGYAEEAIQELIKTLCEFYDFKNNRFSRRIKTLSTFLAVLRAGSGLAG